jgi:DNA mismatch repair protein MutS2
VVIRRTGRRGKVVRRDRGKRWIVETETMRLSVLPSEMGAAGPREAQPQSAGVSFTVPEGSEPPALELHLRGMRVEEAMRALEKQIDSALLHGLKEFHVIHGKGEGILRRAIHDMLRSSPVVQDFHFSAPEEGGFGNTLVVLKG